ncbi:hypothetical protein QP994_09255 [Corynebacterium sp. MSK044]|uniref:hypothetical protein n=1 Tax=Corynebacterium sp. MSK044 TaxID=3050195 RepID=UPI00254EFB98|nr:hypothetical protein [Corynebacterium sp. MSK044]MDK8798063.1 hypothetical protein [Corynebacterium sp. MSK044]
MANSQAETATFDIRNVIGALLGFYGIVLIICSFVLDPGFNVDEKIPKESSDNLRVGIALAVTALVFFLWARLRPIAFNPDTLEAAE